MWPIGTGFWQAQLFSRHCEHEPIARYVAEAAKKDLLRTGWAEDERAASS
jgi:hypothetical protein